MRYLAAVAEEGQMTRAAKRLNLAQPALSQAIAQLEGELGVKLIERHSRGARLTRQGAAFLLKARLALAAEADAIRTAEALARQSRGEVTIGYAGAPPSITSPELFAGISAHHPKARVIFRDLPFPNDATQSWISDVDLAISPCPAIEDGLGVEQIRSEPRAVIASKSHPLSRRTELTVADVLDETFVRYHPTVQPDWAAFHTLDDHRGAPPAHATDDHVLTPLEMLGVLPTSRGIAAVPYADARLAQQAVPEMMISPLPDADPVSICVVWRKDNGNPLIGALIDSARDRAGADGD